MQTIMNFEGVLNGNNLKVSKPPFVASKEFFVFFVHLKEKFMVKKFLIN